MEINFTDSVAVAVDAYFSDLPDVQVAYLFGSYARAQAGPLSDVDIAVLVTDGLDDDTRFALRLRIATDLQKILSSNAVDVIVLNDAPLALSFRVLRDGVILFSRDEDTRILYTALTVNRYLDFAPILARHNRATIERARRGELLNGHNPYRGAFERHRQSRTRP